MADNMSKPTLYPCANRVKMPHVGSDETTFKPVKQEVKMYPFTPSKNPPHSLSKYYMKKISSGFSFEEDVVRERCLHALPYSKKYFLEALDVSNLINRPPPSHKVVGRHDARGSDRRHMPCHIQSRSVHKLKPIKGVKTKKSVAISPSTESEKIDKLQTAKISETQEPGQSVFLTESTSERSPPVTPSNKPQSKWDEYLLSLMSQTTSEWIVKQRVTSGDYKEKLESFLEDRYGTVLDEDPELVKDTVSELDFNAQEQSSKSRWRKADENMLDEVRRLTELAGDVTDPYSDESKAAFYRLPAGFRRAKKYLDKEEAGAINTTAYNIEVKSYHAPPPPTLRDFVNPDVGDKLYNTDNRFEQEWLTGVRQIHQNGADQSEILLETNNRYRKVLINECPQDPQSWYPKTEGECKNDQIKKAPITRLERGLHRWKALPEVIDDTTEKLRAQPTGGDTDQSKEQETSMKTLTSGNLLLRMVDDWRAKWHLDMRYADAMPEDLIRDMADIHPHIRLKAITTCARAAEYCPPPELGIQLDLEATKMEHVKLLPEKLFVALELCLNDESLQVRRAAAITLYTLERPVTQAEDILRQALCDENAIDRWTAAQCLAYFGECDSDVVSELISQLLSAEDSLKHEQAGSLLARLSENSMLVHSMIGEQLNSSSWRHRIMACRVLPKLEGHINKDLVNKLTHLMWIDWHHEVRKMAAQTLGRTGHGKHVHDELRDKIVSGNERMRVEAVSKVGHLGIMTAKLLPAFLHCFEDNYVSVRMEVCIACGNLGIKDEQVLDRLVDLATYDPIWKVKALAIQALGTVAVLNKSIRECILWAFRFEDQAGVRVEACHTIIKFHLNQPDVALILQDRYLVETSPVVKQEIVEALKMFDISPSEDMDMVAQIKTEVRKFCTRNNICAQIVLNEKDTTHEENLERMIYQHPNAAKKETNRYRPISRKIRPPSGDSLPPRIRGTSDISSRPFSQETTDQEIQAIFDRYDDDGLSHVTNLDVTLPESRLDTGYSQKSNKLEIFDVGFDENESNSNQTSRTDVGSRPKSYVTFASPEAEELNESASGGDYVNGETAVTRRNLGEAQTYVEISGNPEEPGEFSEHVLAVAHSSPEASSAPSTVEIDSSQPASTDANTPNPNSEPPIEVPVAVSHSPDVSTESDPIPGSKMMEDPVHSATDVADVVENISTENSNNVIDKADNIPIENSNINDNLSKAFDCKTEEILERNEPDEDNDRGGNQVAKPDLLVVDNSDAVTKETEQ